MYVCSIGAKIKPYYIHYSSQSTFLSILTLSLLHRRFRLKDNPKNPIKQPSIFMLASRSLLTQCIHSEQVSNVFSPIYIGTATQASYRHELLWILAFSYVPVFCNC